MNILTSLREGPRRFLARPFRYFGAEWERMAPRERRWVTGLPTFASRWV